jgi:hypothetical protein
MKLIRQRALAALTSNPEDKGGQVVIIVWIDAILGKNAIVGFE